MFQRLAKLIRGFFGLFVAGLEKRSPEALIEVEKQNLRQQISEYNKGLEAHASLCERLISQVRNLETQEEQLRAKAAANLKAGNQSQAGRYAFQLQSVQRELEENRKQVAEAERTYEELVRARDLAVTDAREKIDQLKRDVDDMRMKKALAELNEMAAGAIGSIGGSGDTMERLHDMVREQRDKAAGRARLARDSVNTTEIQDMEAEQQALEKLALAEFAAESGIVLEAPADEAPAGGELAQASTAEDGAQESEKTM